MSVGAVAVQSDTQHDAEDRDIIQPPGVTDALSKCGINARRHTLRAKEQNLQFLQGFEENWLGRKELESGPHQTAET